MVSKSLKTVTATLVAFFMLILILKPSLYMQAISDGLKLFALSVLPAMFPFFFFSRLLTSLEVAKHLSIFTKKPTKYLFNSPDIGGYILVMSMLSGYPVGAKLVGDSYEKGLCSKEEAKSLIAFTSTSGPLFILGTIGIGMMGNYTAGIIILITHYIATIVNGILFKSKKSVPSTSTLKLIQNYDNILSDAINSSISSILMVGGFIAIFNMIIVAMNDIGAITMLCDFFSKLGISPALSEGVITGIIEVTRGALVLSAENNPKIVIPLIASLVSFGGMSVTLQSLSFLSKCGIKPSYYLATKSSQALISFALAYLVCSFVF